MAFLVETLQQHIKNCQLARCTYQTIECGLIDVFGSGEQERMNLDRVGSRADLVSRRVSSLRDCMRPREFVVSATTYTALSKLHDKII